jgi:hypothetical protein
VITGTLAATEVGDLFTSVVTSISDVQSFTLILRNIFYDSLASDPYFAGFAKRKNKMLTIPLESLPYLGVYIIDEIMGPDGEPNQTEIKFSHTARIGFSVIVPYNDPVVAEKIIDAAFWHIMNRLWRDPVIMNVLHANSLSNPDNIRVESINRGVRKHVYGTAQANNETPTAELQYDVSIYYRSEWPPIIADELEGIDMRTGVKADDTVVDMAQRQQAGVTVDYETAASTGVNYFAQFRNRLKGGRNG